MKPVTLKELYHLPHNTAFICNINEEIFYKTGKIPGSDIIHFGKHRTDKECNKNYNECECQNTCWTFRENKLMLIENEEELETILAHKALGMSLKF